MLARPTTPYQRFKGVARSACRNWGDEEEPDWAVGKLSSKGDWELDGVSGNFKATYDGDTAVHALDVEDYADSVEGQPEHAWVLLDKVPAALPKPKEATTEPPASKAAGKRKARSADSGAGSSSGAAGGATQAGGKRRNRELEPEMPTAEGATPQVDLSRFSATQLAELQVRIAQAMQGGSA